MICVYERDCEDFTTNGLAILTPFSCIVHEVLNGAWEVTIEHPIDADGKWRYLTCGNQLRVPVPAAPSLRSKFESTSTRLAYRVTYAHTMVSAVKNGKTIKRLTKNSHVFLIDRTTDTMWEVEDEIGNHGWARSRYLEFDESYSETTVNENAAHEQTRPQPFRIVTSVPELGKITVTARHVFYDLADNMILKLEPKDTDLGQFVFNAIGDSTLSEHPFTFRSNLTSQMDDVSWIGRNPVDILLGSEGFVEKYGGELGRDWFDVYMMDRIGDDNGVQIREGKNLTGITYTIDSTNVVTRIYPVGQTSEGTPLYLRENPPWIDSPNHFNDYPHPMWSYMDVDNARVGSTDENDVEITTTKARKNLRLAAEKAFENGCDLPTVTVSVNFVNLARTVEYSDFGNLQDIFIGDTVHVFVPSLGISVAMRMTEYQYDCLSGLYTEMLLGSTMEMIESSSITGRQIVNGSITSNALANGAVDSKALAADVINARHIQSETIGTKQLAAESVTAGKLAAGSVTADKIAAGAITAEKLDATSIDTKVLNAVKANIGNADIGYAQIKDASMETAFIRRGNADDYYIDKLKATSAQMLSLMVGTLVFRGDDGKYYTLSASTVNGSVELTATEYTGGVNEVTGETSDGSRTLFESTVNVEELTASSIHAADAIITRLRADQLWANQAFLNRLITTDISSNTFIQLAITGAMERYIRLMSDGVHIGATGKMSEVVIDEDSVNVNVNGMTFNELGSNYLRLGNPARGTVVYDLRQAKDGGIVFKAVKR